MHAGICIDTIYKWHTQHDELPNNNKEVVSLDVGADTTDSLYILCDYDQTGVGNDEYHTHTIPDLSQKWTTETVIG